MKKLDRLIVVACLLIVALTGCARSSPDVSMVPTPGSQVSPLGSPIETPEPVIDVPGKIVFHSSRVEGTYQIFVMDQNGENVTQVTSFGSPSSEPTWAPDGSRVAFTSNMDNPSSFAIYTIAVDGTDLQKLTDGMGADNWYPSWSPDGKTIAFQSNRDGNLEIYTVDVESGTEVRLTSNEYTDSMPRWSPDGTKLVFVSSPSGEGDIFVMNADGSNAQRLTDVPGQNTQPAWSPDGERIVFISGRDGNGEIYVMDANGNNQQRLTETDVYSENTPYWAAGGTQILFSAPYDNDWEVYVMDPDGGNVERLTYVRGDDRHAIWLEQD